MEQLYEKNEAQVSDCLSDLNTTVDTSRRSLSPTSSLSPKQSIEKVTCENSNALKKEKKEKITKAKVSLMHNRWEGKLKSRFTKEDQILIDDETVKEYSELVNEHA